eukprot:1851223-Prymnesium_polylepis.1
MPARRPHARPLALALLPRRARRQRSADRATRQPLPQLDLPRRCRRHRRQRATTAGDCGGGGASPAE